MLRKSFRDRLDGDWPIGSPFNVDYSDPKYDWRHKMSQLNAGPATSKGKDAVFAAMGMAGDAAAENDEDSDEWRAHCTLMHQVSTRSAAVPFVNKDDNNSLQIQYPDYDGNASGKPSAPVAANTCCVIM